MLTIFLGFSAVNTGNNLIYLIVSAFLSFMGISGFFGKNNIFKVDVVVGFPDEVYANSGVPLKITLINQKRFLPAFLIEVRVDNNKALFPFVSAGSESMKYVNAVFTERGRRTIGNIHVCSVFPFNFFVRCRRIRKAPELIVFPAPKRCELWNFFEKEMRLRGEKASNKTGYEGDIVSFRNYAQGDPVKYIFWKASAKTGELKTKELSSLTHQPITIDFDRIDIKNTEEKLSCVTYTILKLFRQNIPVGLKMGENLFKANLLSAHKTSMLKELALYGKN